MKQNMHQTSHAVQFKHLKQFLVWLQARRWFRAGIASLLLAFASVATLGLSACSDSAGSENLAIAQAYDVLAKEGRGFGTGSMMASNTVYVLFDPQCPHCGHLWETVQAMKQHVKFVWLPVAFIGPASATQGAALLSAADPVAAMTAHEASLLAGQGGTAASANVPDDIATAIRKNTDLFKRIGGESVPYIVAKNARTGAVVGEAGALDAEGLVQFLGL